jgi:hypothetical protein
MIENTKTKYGLFLVILLIITLITVSIPGCSNIKTYTGKVGDVTYTFQCRKDYIVNPPGHFNSNVIVISSNDKVVDPFYPESYIRVTATLRYGSDVASHLDQFISETKDNRYISDFQEEKIENIIIAGLSAKYTAYTYYGYTTIPIIYYGQVVCFNYRDYIVDIHLLFPSMVGPWSDPKEAFNLLKNTFKIK